MSSDYLRGLKDTYIVLSKGWVTMAALAVKTDVSRMTAYSRTKAMGKLGFVIEQTVARRPIGPLASVYRIVPHKDDQKKFEMSDDDLVAIIGSKARRSVKNKPLGFAPPKKRRKKAAKKGAK